MAYSEQSVPHQMANELLQRSVSVDLSPLDDLDGTPVDELPKVKDILRDAMIQCLQNVEERFQTYSKKCLKLMEAGCINPKKVQRAIFYMENYLMQKFREREPFIIEKDDTRNHTHRQVLKKCYTSLIDDLDLQNTSVLDLLIQDDVMSIADKESIIIKGTNRSRNEEFYRYIEGRVTLEEFHRSLVPAIREGHSHLADMLLKEADELDESTEDAMCVTCKVFKIVQVKRLATPLYKRDVIDSSLHADLKSTAITNSQKWSELEKAGVSHDNIINAMRIKYVDFYREFRRKKVDKLVCFCEQVPDNVSVVSEALPATPAPTVSGLEPSSMTSEGRESAADVALVKDLEPLMLLPTEDTELEYPMDARPRGICLIINNTDFEENPNAQRENPHLGRREGSDMDAKRLDYIFSKLEFQVRTYTNLTDMEMVRTMEDVAHSIDHTPYNAFACCVLSHCMRDVVYGTNCKVVRMSELTSPFRATACPSLAGKPKMFFVQGAQGHLRMQGLKVPDVPDMAQSLTEKAGEAVEVPPEPNVTQTKCEESETSHKEDIETNIIPDEADFLIGYSTSPGYVSYRSRHHGSWYIIKLAEILDSQADNKDLLNCLLMVNNEISKGNAFMGDGVFKQVPAPMFTLRRKVNLTSDPRWSRSLSCVGDEENG